MQLVDVCVQSPHTLVLYGVAHELAREKVFDPLKCSAQASARVSTVGMQVGGFHVQVSCVSCHWPWTCWPYGSGQVFWRVYVLLPLWLGPQASVLTSWLGRQVGGAGWQVLLALYQPESTDPAVVQLMVRFQVSLPTWLTPQARVWVSVLGVQLGAGGT